MHGLPSLAPSVAEAAAAATPRITRRNRGPADKEADAAGLVSPTNATRDPSNGGQGLVVRAEATVPASRGDSSAATPTAAATTPTTTATTETETETYDETETNHRSSTDSSSEFKSSAAGAALPPPSPLPASSSPPPTLDAPTQPLSVGARHPSTPSHFLTFSASPEIDEIGRLFQRGAYTALAMYAVLLVVVLKHAPVSSWEEPTGTEQMAHVVSFLLLLVVNGSRLAPLVALRHRRDDDDLDPNDATDNPRSNDGNNLTKDQKDDASSSSSPSWSSPSSLLNKSGFWIGTLSVQLMALSANGWLGFFSSPVLVDPVTGLRSHLVRWVEWTALAFLMTFLTNNVEAPFLKRAAAPLSGIASPTKGKGTTATTNTVTSTTTHVGYAKAISLALSTSAGLVFPFIHSVTLWWIVMIASCVLFLPVYVLLHKRYTRYNAYRRLRLERLHQRQYPKKGEEVPPPHDPSGSSFPPVLSCRPSTPLPAQDEERYELARTSFVLSAVCATAWTGLSVFYLVACAGHAMYGMGSNDSSSSSSIWASESLNSIGMCFFEIASKVCYLSVLIEAYTKVFDENARAVRRLEELRNFMAAVWESSSDVIVYCNKQDDGRITARVSPSFFKIIDGHHLNHPTRGVCGGDALSSVFLEIDPSTGEFSYFTLNLSQVITAHDIPKIKSSLEASRASLVLGKPPAGQDGHYTLEQQSLATLARLAIKACAQECGKEVSDMIDLVKVEPLTSESFSATEIDSSPRPPPAVRTARCETKTIRSEDGSAVLILRDISDRVHRFETEKLLLQEITKRKKDEETNSFTRHEIKNGILAAIALLDHIRDSSVSTPSTTTGVRRGLSSSLPSSSLSSHKSAEAVEEGFFELENTLRDMLDTILDNTMTREIVYGQYVPRKEPMNVPEVLLSLRRRACQRFPLHVLKAPLPLLALDRQLIRFIHRNAISNACKYGKHEGTVETILSHDTETKTFQMQVWNEPGDGHDALLALDEATVESVFCPKTKLCRATQRTSIGADGKISAATHESSGNGGWIMQKCAEALGGKCSIEFQTKRTVFHFTCPAEAMSINRQASKRRFECDSASFALPPRTWGIAVDDSLIQRKLMDRFLKMCGISDDRKLILGKDSEEIFGFCDTVARLLQENPADVFLLIVDENLEIEAGGSRHETVSGSQCVQTLREQLEETAERRLLALIRSANDSLSDLNRYKSRAHGYLHKEPIPKDKVLDVLRPWWTERFSVATAAGEVSSEAGEFLSSEGAAASDNSDASDYSASPEDIRESFSVINALIGVADEAVLEQRWGTIREKLHVLKGDLKTMELGPNSLLGLIRPLDRLSEAPQLPASFSDEWGTIKTQAQGSLFGLTSVKPSSID